jgi:hypothetical protein
MNDEILALLWSNIWNASGREVNVISDLDAVIRLQVFPVLRP